MTRAACLTRGFLAAIAACFFGDPHVGIFNAIELWLSIAVDRSLSVSAILVRHAGRSPL